MSKPTKAAGAASAKGEDLPFEEALTKLESIVEAMEAGDLPLEALLARFEEGTRLAHLCQTKLADAELKIQQLEKTASGDLVLKPVGLAEDAAGE
jgi:exodeoxyribonuclease VII small subunit